MGVWGGHGYSCTYYITPLHLKNSIFVYVALIFYLSNIVKQNIHNRNIRLNYLSSNRISKIGSHIITIEYCEPSMVS
jgi:hypothetical protein